MRLSMVPSQEIKFTAKKTLVFGGFSSATKPTHTQQEESLWCWAACLWMVRTRHETSILQCEIACDRYPHLSCCDYPRDCNCAQPLAAVGPFWDLWLDTRCSPLGAKAHEGTISYKEVTSELDQGRPVLLLVNGAATTSGGKLMGAGHLVLAAGHVQSTTCGDTLEIYDPEETWGPQQVAFHSLLKRWSWSATWTRIGCKEK